MAIGEYRVVSQKDVADFFGVSQKTVSVWKSEGMFAEAADGTYSLKEAARGLVKRRTAGSTDRARLEAARADMAELELDKMRATLIERDAVEHLWSEAGQVFRDKLLAMASGLADDLAATTNAADVVRLLTREFTAALEDMAAAIEGGHADQ